MIPAAADRCLTANASSGVGSRGGQQVHGDAGAGQHPGRLQRELIDCGAWRRSRSRRRVARPPGRRRAASRPAPRSCRGPPRGSSGSARPPPRRAGRRCRTPAARRTGRSARPRPPARRPRRGPSAARSSAGQLGPVALVWILGQPGQYPRVQVVADHVAVPAVAAGTLPARTSGGSGRAAPPTAGRGLPGPAAMTSAWSSPDADRPAAGLVTSEIPSTSAPRWRAAIASSAVDMPTMSAPAS